MTDPQNSRTKEAAATTAGPPANSRARQRRQPALHSGKTIVPREGVAGQALMTVIAIMAFLACLTLGSVLMIRDTARGWQNDISREVTVQIRPFDDVEMEKAIRAASELLLSFDGISKVTVLNEEDTVKLLEPWLGSGVKPGDLPVPRLITVSIGAGAIPDFAAIRDRLEKEVPGASLDDHRSWVNRLNAMAGTTILAGTVVFALVLVATVLTVVFATRGAMAGNRQIVEVLHFIGADGRFIAREFERHFLRLGFEGAALGGGLAAVCFVALGLWISSFSARPEAGQILAMFGDFHIGPWGFGGIGLVAIAVAVLTAATSRWTVMRHVGMLETYGGGDG